MLVIQVSGRHVISSPLFNTSRLFNRVVRPLATSSNQPPRPSFHSGLIKSIHKNISLRSCVSTMTGRRGAAVASSLLDKTDHQVLVSNKPERPLAILLTWLAAKEKNIEKYRTLWFNRGFDVLTVKMDPHQMVLPAYGAIPLIQDLIRFLSSVVDVYPDMVFHLFSVGGYQYGEMLYQLQNEEFLSALSKEGKEDEVDKTRKKLAKAIKGIFCDSIVDVDEAPRGVSRAFTGNPSIQRAMETTLRAQLHVMHPVLTKYLERGRDYGLMSHGDLTEKAPGVVFASDVDLIGTASMAERIVNTWKNYGIDATLKTFKGSGHVMHYAKYPTEYLEEVDRLLKKVKLDTVPQ